MADNLRLAGRRGKPRSGSAADGAQPALCAAMTGRRQPASKGKSSCPRGWGAWPRRGRRGELMASEHAEAARALDRLAPVEQSAQGEIIAAVAPLIACDASGEPLTACVMNRSDRVAKSFLVREPDREQRIDDLLFPGHGLRVAVSSSTGLRISR